MKKTRKEYNKLFLIIVRIIGKILEFPPQQKEWKKFEEDNKTIALNILYVPHNTEQIRLAYKSKYNHKHKNQLIFLMITDGKKWRYLAVRSLSALLGIKTLNHNGDFYCLNCLHSIRTKKNL